MPSAGSNSHRSDEYWMRNNPWAPLYLQPPHGSDYDASEQQSVSTSSSYERTYSQVLQSRPTSQPSQAQAAPPSRKRKRAKSDSPQSDSSYYSFDENFHARGRFTRIRASDARAQVQKAPAPIGSERYPSEFFNHEDLNIQAAVPYQHIPVFSERQQSQHPQPRRHSGPYRAVYNDNDRETFDLMYHDPRKARSASGEHYFSLGHYHPSSRN